MNPKQEECFNRMMTMLKGNNIKAVSFDIFDTLITRPFLYPTDLFFLMESDFSSEYDGKETFSQLRTKAEINARKNAVASEPNLNDIYYELQQLVDISPEFAEKLANHEKELEIHFSLPRQCGIELFNQAVKLNKKVVLTSDMYLPKDIIVKILEKHNIKGYKTIFLSNELKLNKSDGEIYKHVIKKLKVNSHQILHIGDNLQYDVEMPINNEMLSLYLPSCREQFFKSGRLCEYIYQKIGKKINTEKYFSLRCLMGLYALYAFDYPSSTPYNSDFCENYSCMGFAVLGGLYMQGKFSSDDELETEIFSAMQKNNEICQGKNDFIKAYSCFGDMLKKFGFEGCNIPFLLLLNHGNTIDRSFFSKSENYEIWNNKITEFAPPVTDKSPKKSKGSITKKFLDKIKAMGLK